MVTIPDRIGVVLVGTDGVPYEIGASSGGVSQQDNTAFTAGTDSGTPVEGIYEATPSTITDGRVGVVGITANRVLKAALHDAAGSAITTLPVSLASVPSHAVTNAGTFAVQAAGDVAHDASDSGSPVKIGGYASSTTPTSVSSGDRVNTWLNLGGAVVISGGGNEMSADAQSLGVPLVQRVGNASAGPLGVLPVLYNGSTFDRARGDTTNGLDVDVTRLPSATIAGTTAATGSGTATGALRVELPTNGTGIVGLAAGTNGIGKLTANSGVDIGDVDVTSIAAGTNLIGDVSLQPRTTSGNACSVFMASGSDGSSILVATAQAAKGSAGNVYGWYIYNPEAAVSFVHFYDVASGSVTVGTTNPKFTLAIPAGAAANIPPVMAVANFATAITVAATTTAGGNTAPSTGVSLVLFYK